MTSIIGFIGDSDLKCAAIELLSFKKGMEKVPFKVLKFSQPLNDMQEMLYRRIDSVYKRPDNCKPDEILKSTLEHAWLNYLPDNVLISLWTAAAEKLVKSYVVICDDVEGDEEIAAIKQSGGTVIDVNNETISSLTEIYNKLFPSIKAKNNADY